nr:tyrosine-type recombinase/integrase [uncultured Dysosmobacter sp.]
MQESRSSTRLLPTAQAQLDTFCCHLKEEEKSGATIQKYCHDIRCFLAWVGSLETLSKDQVMEYKAMLETKYAVRSANSMISAVNSFLRYMGREECCVKQFRFQENTFCDCRKELRKEEYFRLLDAAKGTGRNQMYYLLQTICATGIRVSELRFITVEALREKAAVARNKGKSRVILLPSGLCTMLLEYARENGIAEGPVFLSRRGNTLNRSNIWSSMKRLGNTARVPLEKIYPHNLRHIFARPFYQQEKDISHLADILGHQSVNTTRGYIISSGEEHREQIETLGLVDKICDDADEKITQHNVRLCSGNRGLNRCKGENHPVFTYLGTK